MANIRTVESTDPAPMPSLIASPETPDEIIETLRATLLSVGARDELAGLRDELCLAGFGTTAPADYQTTLDRAAKAEAAGYSGPV
jgi:ABC-type phosphate/phosphonate transport system substrate-binding protein